MTQKATAVGSRLMTWPQSKDGNMNAWRQNKIRGNTNKNNKEGSMMLWACFKIFTALTAINVRPGILSFYFIFLV